GRQDAYLLQEFLPGLPLPGGQLYERVLVANTGQVFTQLAGLLRPVDRVPLPLGCGFALAPAACSGCRDRPSSGFSLRCRLAQTSYSAVNQSSACLRSSARRWSSRFPASTPTPQLASAAARAAWTRLAASGSSAREGSAARAEG